LKEVPNFPSGDRHAMWIGKDELLNWSPRSDVAKPYPVPDRRKGGAK
jgi:hypothetical protein